MKHIIISGNWKYGEEPFPAYRIDLVYGHNKRDREFLPVQGVKPVIQYTTRAGFGLRGLSDDSGEIIYQGASKAEAEKAEAEHEALPEKDDKPAVVIDDEYDDYDAPVSSLLGASLFGSSPSKPWAKIIESQPTLPENEFRLITTKAKGTKMIVSGKDSSDDALVFVGCEEGFRGDVQLVDEATTGEIVKTCQAGNATGGEIEIIVRLRVGQSVGFHTSGRRTNEVYVYTWDGTKIEKKHYSKSEWNLQEEMIVEATEVEETAVEQTESVEETIVSIPLELLNRLMAGSRDLAAVFDANEYVKD